MRTSGFTTAMALAGSLLATGCTKQPPIPIDKTLQRTITSVAANSQKALQSNPKLQCYDSIEFNTYRGNKPNEFLSDFQEVGKRFFRNMPKESIGEGYTHNAVLPNDLTDIRLDKYRKSTLIPVITGSDTTDNLMIKVKVKACAEPSPLL